MTNLKIDLQQSHIDFKIFPTKIDMHIKQAKPVNALRHQYEGPKLNSRVICAQTYMIKLFEFSPFWIFYTHKKQKHKSKIKCKNNKNNAYKKMQDA